MHHPIVHAAMTADMSSIPWIGTPAAARIAFVALAAIWGAIFGSFINVIVHRLPRGESPLAGRSRCPQCHAAIRARDNIPVVGWLLRGGACRDCGGRIAATYPLVEAACGVLCGALAAGYAARGDVDGLSAGEWRPLLALALRAVVMLVIFTWALLEPRGWPKCPGAGPLTLAVASLATAIPAAGPAGLLPDGRPWPAGAPAVAGGLAAVAGIVIGHGGGRLAGTATARCGLPLLGAALGWQAVTVVAALTALCRGLARLWLGRDRQTLLRQSSVLANTMLIFAGAAVATVVHAVPAARGWP